MDYKKIDQYLTEHLDDSVEELKDLCRIPTVAAQNLNLDEGAAAVGDLLKKRGFNVEILPTNGAPVVYAERSGKVDKTILFYNHYDVQPAEPLDLWESPPFDPDLRDGKLYARGVSDDKGHITSRLFAIDAILESEGELPCNVKFIIEGEEEISSINLPDTIKKYAEKFSGDVCIWEFGGVDHRDVPLQYTGLRGICYVQLEAETAKIDAHSGLGGTIFPNAAWRLVWALNTLKDADENVLIPGFYDNVVAPSKRDHELFDLMPDPAEEYKTRFGIKEFLKGTKGGSELMIQETLQPSCTICGLTSGYQGPGSKTVLPAQASAKVDFRLVPDQTPEEIVAKLRDHLDANGFEDIKVNFLGGEAPGRTDPDHPFIKLVVDSAEEVYEEKMQVVPMIGGSGPNHAFLHYLGVPVATAGAGYPDTRAHAPNENIRIDLYHKHARHVVRILNDFTENYQV